MGGDCDDTKSKHDACNKEGVQLELPDTLF